MPKPKRQKDTIVKIDEYNSYRLRPAKITATYERGISTNHTLTVEPDVYGVEAWIIVSMWSGKILGVLSEGSDGFDVQLYHDQPGLSGRGVIRNSIKGSGPTKQEALSAARL